VDLKRLGRGDIVAASGGFVLLVSLFLPWYGVSGNENLCGVGADNCSAFQTFKILDVLLVLASLAPWILFWIVVRANELSWPPGEVTMASAMVAIVLILYNGLLDQPGQNQNFVSLDIGWFVGLLGAMAIASGGAMSQVARGGVSRKPPGSF
jgi:hypothetical protein